jgi:release factor family 12
MSNKTTWAVLSDGRYIKVMVNTDAADSWSVLDADKNTALAELCYQMVNCKPLRLGKETSVAGETNFIQLQADFLSEQHEQGLFDSLVIAAPQDVATSLRDALSEPLKQLVAGELAEDILASSNDVIDNKLAKFIS